MKTEFEFSKFFDVRLAPFSREEIKNLAVLCFESYKQCFVEEFRRRIFISFIVYDIELENGEFEQKRIYMRDLLKFLIENIILKDRITHYTVTFRNIDYQGIPLMNLLKIIEYGGMNVYPYRLVSTVVARVQNLFDTYLEQYGKVIGYEFEGI